MATDRRPQPGRRAAGPRRPSPAGGWRARRCAAIKVVWQRELIRFCARPPAHRHLAAPAAALPVRARQRPVARSPPAAPAGVDFTTFMFPGVLAMSVLFTAIFCGRLDRVGPRVRLPARDARRARAARLDRARQVPRRRDRRRLPGRASCWRSRRSSDVPYCPVDDRRAARAAAAARVHDHRVRRDGGGADQRRCRRSWR